MADLREKIGRATQTSDMGWRDGVTETDVDRIGALGIAARETRLGAAITRWIGAGQDSAYLTVVECLVSLILARYGRVPANVALHIALQACREYSQWACVECSGRGTIVSGEGVKFVCPTCDGSTLRWYSDHTRADAMRMSVSAYRTHAASRLAWTIGQLRIHDHQARSVAHTQLSDTTHMPNDY